VPQTTIGRNVVPARLPRALKIVLGLLWFSAFINYVDRGNLSIAAPLLKDELGLSPSQLGILLSSFFWTYSSFQLVAGWAVDRFDVSVVMAAGFFIWSAATAATGWMHGFAALLLMRLVLGVGESVAYPSYSKILAGHCPEERKGIANAVLASGLSLGPAFGIFAGGILIGKVGWREYFIVLGFSSMVWLLPWWRFKLKARAEKSKAKLGYREILKQRSAWGTCAGLFCGNFMMYFLLTWLPYYLVRERHFSMGEMARIGGLAYILTATTALISGWAADKFMAAGKSATVVRKGFLVSGMAGAGVFLVLCVAANPRYSIGMLMAASAFLGMATANWWPVTQTMAGPHAAGRWVGVQNLSGNFSGVVAPAVTGFVVERTGEFYWAFVMVGVVALLGSLVWMFWVGPVEPVQWEDAVIGSY
jgi:ACS family D-galactonate transporter-like MFS transporter